MSSGAAILAVLALCLGCDSPGGAKTSCKTDDVCGGGVCVDGVCLAHPAGRTVAVEVTPSPASLAATTELLGLTLSGQAVDLVADEEASIVGTVTSTSLFSTEAHVAIGIQSRIPGRADLQINAEMAKNQFGFSVPSGRVGMATTATFRFLPGSTAQTQPPVPLKASLTSTVALQFPLPKEMKLVRGKLVGADGRALVGDAYPARVSFKGVPVSNVVAPDGTGSFTLLVPPGATPDPPDDLVTLTIGTSDNPDNAPVLTTNAVSLASLASSASAGDAVHVYTMPAFLPAAPVAVKVLADMKDQSGVTVRLRTDIPTPDGTARFERSAMTDGHGDATIMIIPGPVDAPLPYQASIEAPSDASFPYSSLCSGDLQIALGPSGTIADLAPFNLLPKHELSGSVSDTTAAPVPGARVTATQIGGGTACVDSSTPNAVSATTDSTGNYLLLVAPGTYRLDVKPAATSPWPRLTETESFIVSHATVYPLRLPAGEVVQGRALGADQATLLPGASITIFQVFCLSAPCPSGTAPPLVLAETQADSSGNFRAVLPAP